MNKYIAVYFHKILLQHRLGLLCGVFFFIPKSITSNIYGSNLKLIIILKFSDMFMLMVCKLNNYVNEPIYFTQCTDTVHIDNTCDKNHF